MYYLNKFKSKKKTKLSPCKSGGGQKGVSLYFAIIILSILLAIVLGLGTILVGQTRMIKGMGDSVVAFYAADSGIEIILLNRDSLSNITKTTLANSATYEVFVVGGGTGDCPAGFLYCIKSIGTYEGTRRAIEISY